MACRFHPDNNYGFDTIEMMTAAAVASAVATVSLLLSLLLSLTVVASRGRIRVTVFIGDCQARVSSSSEGCPTSQKTVKVEAY